MNEEKKKKVIKKISPKDEKIKLLTEQNSMLNDKVLRLNAEMQNMARHFNDERANFYKYDGESLVKKILPIIDNFERAINLDDNNLTDELSKFLSGFKMIYANLISTLNSIGVKEIETLDKEFDPNMMEAITTGKDESKKSGIVLEVMQKGYMYNDKVIRPSMVKVNE